MISVVICSKRPRINPELEENIQKTIGVEHEIIVIDNSKNEYSIFSAYNQGLRKCNFPIICFVHDDVIFKTANWGTKVCRHLSDSSIGIIGVAGGETITKVPTSWSESGAAKNFIQSAKSPNEKSKHKFAQKDLNSISHEVVLLDGVWLCMRRDIFRTIKFDDITFDGFHCYDIDICLQSKQAGYKNFVVYDILLEHFSSGYRNREWVENIIKIESKWREFLPVSVANYTEKELSGIQQKSLFNLLKRMVRLGFTRKEIVFALSDLWLQTFTNKSINDLNIRIMYMKTLHMLYIH